MAYTVAELMEHLRTYPGTAEVQVQIAKQRKGPCSLFVIRDDERCIVILSDEA